MTSPAELQALLEWAGIRLIALPGARLGPQSYRSFWPDIQQDPWEVAKFCALPVRAIAPTPAEITLVENILTLPNTLGDVWKRRVLHARALLHPLTTRHLFPWTRIAATLGTSVYNVKSLHSRGLREVIQSTPPQRLESLISAIEESVAA